MLRALVFDVRLVLNRCAARRPTGPRIFFFLMLNRIDVKPDMPGSAEIKSGLSGYTTTSAVPSLHDSPRRFAGHTTMHHDDVG